MPEIPGKSFVADRRRRCWKFHALRKRQNSTLYELLAKRTFRPRLYCFLHMCIYVYIYNVRKYPGSNLSVCNAYGHAIRRSAAIVFALQFNYLAISTHKYCHFFSIPNKTLPVYNNNLTSNVPSFVFFILSLETVTISKTTNKTGI